MTIVGLLALRSIAVIIGHATSGGIGRGLLAAMLHALAWSLLFVLFPLALVVALVLPQMIVFSLAP